MPVYKLQDIGKKELCDCKFSGAGIAKFSKGSIAFDRHFHDADEYWVVIDGALRVESEGQDYILHRGEMLYTFMGQEHMIFEALEDTTVFWLEGELRGQKRPGHLHKIEESKIEL